MLPIWRGSILFPLIYLENQLKNIKIPLFSFEKTRGPESPEALTCSFNNVKIGQVQLRLIIKHILFYHIWCLQPFWSSDLKQYNEFSIKQTSDFLDRYVAVQMNGIRLKVTGQLNIWNLYKTIVL